MWAGLPHVADVLSTVNGSQAASSAPKIVEGNLDALAIAAGGDGGRKSMRGRIANAKSVGWAIYAAGFAGVACAQVAKKPNRHGRED